ncbi:MAG: DUF5672 family protein [Spirosomataceae bacterium]
MSVAVVIPIYRSTLTPHEQISLQQCLKVLAQYPIVVVKPVSLELIGWQPYLPVIQQISLPDYYFEGIAGYNKMMLSATFYQQFSQFDYILIHQLDAFVFSDQLQNWCQKGYDYIGAPWLKDVDFKSTWEEQWFNLKKWIAIRWNLKKADGITPKEIQSINSVGNGGFSLRKVNTFLQAIAQFSAEIEHYLTQPQHHFNEDVFWSIEVNRRGRYLQIPDWRVALHFAVEFFPEKAYRFNNQQLPFGCHAWDIHETEFWRPYFKAQGYDI